MYQEAREEMQREAWGKLGTWPNECTHEKFTKLECGSVVECLPSGCKALS